VGQNLPVTKTVGGRVVGDAVEDGFFLSASA
jgi:hypothetical protein